MRSAAHRTHTHTHTLNGVLGSSIKVNGKLSLELQSVESVAAAGVLVRAALLQNDLVSAEDAADFAPQETDDAPLVALWKTIGINLRGHRARLNVAAAACQRLLGVHEGSSKETVGKIKLVLDVSASNCSAWLGRLGKTSFADLISDVSKHLLALNSERVLSLAGDHPVKLEEIAKIAKTEQARDLYVCYTALENAKEVYGEVSMHYSVGQGGASMPNSDDVIKAKQAGVWRWCLVGPS